MDPSYVVMGMEFRGYVRGTSESRKGAANGSFMPSKGRIWLWSQEADGESGELNEIDVLTVNWVQTKFEGSCVSLLSIY